MIRNWNCVVLILIALSYGTVRSAEPFQTAFFQSYCLDCHDADTRKGGLDLSTLGTNFENKRTFDMWVNIFDRVVSGEMPPKKRERPAAEEGLAFLDALKSHLNTADQLRIAQEGRAVTRRLTRSEYENALRDLLSLPELQIKDLLPADGAFHGFDKIGEALDLSYVQIASYMEAVHHALDAAICTQPKAPIPLAKWRMYPASSFKFRQAVGPGNGVLLKDKSPDPLYPAPSQYKDETYGKGIGDFERIGGEKSQSAVAVFQPAIEGWYTSTLFAPVHRGRYKLRFSTWSLWWNAGKVEPARRVETATLISGPNERGYFNTLGYFDAPSLKSRQHESTATLGPGDEVIFDAASLTWHGLQVRQFKGGAAAHVGPAVALDWFEVEGPFYDQWPPESHKRLFGELPILPFDTTTNLTPPYHPAPKQTKGYAWPKNHELPREEIAPVLHSVYSEAPLDDAKSLLAKFLPRAFRREVSDEELSRYVALVQARLEKNDCFEIAMRHAYRSALTSTSFLIRRENTGILNNSALATRLALWLWNSIPDEELLELARQNVLHEPQTLHHQVERMLNDPRSERFITDFLGQWLKLQDIDATDPDRTLYPEFDRYLKESMLAESRAFFRELIRRDLPASNIVASEFAMLNQRLAEHYGIPGVIGATIRPVPLPPNSGRGGFLTQASVLKVTANGTVSSPIVRGVFVSERILGQPVPPPPPGVPAVDPDTRGATTIREQLAKHRVDSCAACHAKIDPPGFALEGYDVIGGFRQHYRSLEKGKPAAFKFPDGRGVHYKVGPPVDSAGETTQGEPFKDFTDFQGIVLAKRNQVARAFVKHMITYATGAEISFSDRLEIDQILTQTEKSDYGIRTLLHAISKSRLFQMK